MTKTESTDKKNQAISLKMAGFKQKDIALKLGISEQSISKWFKKILVVEMAKENRIKLFDLQIQKELETPNPDILLVKEWTKAKADYVKGYFQ